MFATATIKKGARICFLKGEVCTLDEILKRVKAGKEEPSDPLGIGEELYLDLDELSRTFNHSCNPNAFLRGKSELVAMRNIKQGEEITYDYSTTMNDNKAKINKAGFMLWTCRCNCKAKNCRKSIRQFKTLPEKRKKFYTTNNYMPTFVLKAFSNTRKV